MKKFMIILSCILILILGGCDINLTIDGGESSGQYDRGTQNQDAVNSNTQTADRDISSGSSTTSDQKPAICDEYFPGVASTFELYTDCVDNEVTKAMRSGEPYFCEVSMDTTYVDLKSSIYEMWILGDLIKYTHTITYSDGKSEYGTHIIKREGTYTDPSGTHFLLRDLDKSKDWIFTPASERQPSYNVAGDITPPSTATCEKKNFGKEMFDTSGSSSGQTGSTATTSTSQEKLEQSVRVIDGNAAAKWGFAHGSLNHIKPEWDAELELETPSSIDMVFKDPFETEEKIYKVEIFNENGLTEDFSVLVSPQEVTLAPGKYTLKITPNTDTASWNVAWS